MVKGMFGKLFGKQEHGGCCDMQIVEESDADTTKAVCDCGGACDIPIQSEERVDNALLVKVLGPGCKKCHQLHDNVVEASKKVDVPIKVEYVTDIAEIAAAGVMSTPALNINGEVVSSGKVLTSSEIQLLLEKAISSDGGRRG